MVGPPNQVMPPEPEVPLPPELVPGVPCQQKPSDTLMSLKQEQCLPCQGHTKRAICSMAASTAGVHDPEHVLPQASRMQDCFRVWNLVRTSPLGTWYWLLASWRATCIAAGVIGFRVPAETSKQPVACRGELSHLLHAALHMLTVQQARAGGACAHACSRVPMTWHAPRVATAVQLGDSQRTGGRTACAWVLSRDHPSRLEPVTLATMAEKSLRYALCGAGKM